VNFAGALSSTDSSDATVVTVDTLSLLAVDNNLSDVSDQAVALWNLGRIPLSTQINVHNLTGNVSLATNDVAQGGAKIYYVQSDWSVSSGLAEILKKSTLAQVASIGQYSDLTGKPSIGTVAEEDIVPVSKGGTGVSGLGSIGQILKVNNPVPMGRSLHTNHMNNSDTFEISISSSQLLDNSSTIEHESTAEVAATSEMFKVLAIAFLPMDKFPPFTQGYFSLGEKVFSAKAIPASQPMLSTL
jgi:hypothetical protein